MVFCEIESITDVRNGYRIIIYYITDRSCHIEDNDERLFKITESALDLLAKKNDDVLLIEVHHNSLKFEQFVDLYQPELVGPITLFSVNNEGIPLSSKNICKVLDVFDAIEKLFTVCVLKPIPRLTQHLTKSEETRLLQSKAFNDNNEIKQEKVTNVKSLPSESADIKHTSPKKPLSTLLQVRLPSGAKEEVQFDNDATLQEIWIVISSKFNIKDFDLKTYNHPIYTEDDYEKTLEHLNLSPRGVIIVVNKNGRLMPRNNTGVGLISAVIQLVCHRLISSSTHAFRYIRGFIFIFWNYLFPSNDASAPRGPRNQEVHSQGFANQSSSQSRSTSRKYAHKKTGNNIHTLHRDDDSDDENNSYNGNSTQQK